MTYENFGKGKEVFEYGNFNLLISNIIRFNWWKILHDPWWGSKCHDPKPWLQRLQAEIWWIDGGKEMAKGGSRTIIETGEIDSGCEE